MNFSAYLLSLGISLVFFLIWGDAFEKKLAQQALEEPEYDPRPILEKIRFSSFFAFASLFLIFLASEEARKAYSPLPQWILLGGVLLQLFFQLQLEKKVRSPEKKEFDFFESLTRGIFCWCLGVVIHLGCLLGTFGVALGIGYGFALTKPIMMILWVLGTGLGILLGLFWNLKNLPFYLKKIFQTLPLSKTKLSSKIQETMTELPQIPPPEVWVLNLPSGTFHPGFLKGWKTTYFFLSEPALNNLSEPQLMAWIQFQLERFDQKTFFKRWIVGGGMLLLGLGLSLSFLWFTPLEGSGGFFSALSTLVCFGGTLQFLKYENQKQERAADLACVLKRGVSLNLWIETLVRLDAQTLEGSEEPWLLSPETASRIQALEKAIEYHSFSHSKTPLRAA